MCYAGDGVPNLCISAVSNADCGASTCVMCNKASAGAATRVFTT